MKIAICDDRVEDRDHLHQLIKRYETENNVTFNISFFESGEDLLVSLKKNTYSIIFLDIYMGGITGMQAATEIRKADSDAAIIFTTTSTDHAVDSYRVKAVYYLLKPVSYSWLVEAIDLCKLQVTAFSKSIELPVGKITVQLRLKDIIYTEIFQKSLSIYTVDGVVLSSVSMERFEALVGGENFLHCHRSYIVNMAHIVTDTLDAFTMDSGASVPISRSSRAMVKKIYNEYLFHCIRS